MIEVQHLNLAFGEGEKRNQVLYDVSFHVKPGEIYGLVGESGRRQRRRRNPGLRYAGNRRRVRSLAHRALPQAHAEIISG